MGDASSATEVVESRTPTLEEIVAAVNASANAATQTGALFGLPLYNGTNAIGQPYSNQLKPGADYLAKRTAQAAYNEGVTNAFTPKGNYMPAWAVQQPAANWLNKGFDTAKYFPGIPGVQANLPAGAGVPRGTNLGFGTLFGSLAPSTQLPGSGAPSETYTSPSIVTGPVTRPPGTTRVVPPPYIGGGGETRVPNTEGVIPREESGPAPYNPGNVFTSPIQNVTGTSTVAQSMGRNYYNPQTFEHSIEALPPELAGAYIPPQYIGHALPAGAFKSLWPNSVGTDWVKVKPEGWSVTWRPTNTRG